VFNLVGKRYLFLIISLIVIIPGTLSLIFKGLYIGIDFAGGSTLEFRPAQHITSTQPIVALLQNLELKDVQINVGTNNTPGNQTAWVRLNTDIDPSVWDNIQTDLKNKYGSNVTYIIDHLQINNNGKAQTIAVITITSTKGALKASDIQAAITKIPDTTDPTKATATPTPTPVATQVTSPALTPTANATATAKATAAAAATATPVATATPAATATVSATPTATATPTNPYVTADNPANIPVQIQSITLGSTKDTINILTTTTTSPTLLNQIKGKFIDQFGNYLSTLDNSSVSGSVAGDTIRNSILAVIAASALILLYVWFAFRKVQKPWRYGTCAIIALLHDVLVVLGVFSILGWTLHIQVDALFVTALLTVVGFSVHDTIVVFDRIRENMQHRSSETFEQIVNASLVQTLSRSLNTSLTVLFTLSALTLFGGESIRTFTFALLIGIFSGTYSSIFNASMLLVIWDRGELGLWRLNPDSRLPDGRRREARARELVKSRG
jgi:preprotein translocase SecF subunit